MHQPGVSHPVADAAECHRLLQSWRTQCCKLWILPSPELTHTTAQWIMNLFMLTIFSKVDRYNVQIYLSFGIMDKVFYSNMVDNIINWHPARIQELSYSAHHRTKWNKPDSKKSIQLQWVLNPRYMVMMLSIIINLGLGIHRMLLVLLWCCWSAFTNACGDQVKISESN